ncbi:hypothetical protein [Haloprofundus halobius]|uniref:hypothetical protein n=1 Tax=Haloprofundus halobius TaxID=2876194 RepID=UPI001CCC2686|nr:hypothetical protein [Haloprofundus halobius]
MMDPRKLTNTDGVRRRQESRLGRIEAFAGEFVWLTPALIVALATYTAYVVTHPYPAFGAGLFLYMAEHIIREGYALPAVIPHYTPEGIPFAYPPLGFYLAAVLHDAFGLSFLTISRYLPGFLTVVYLVPFYLLARELLRSERQAGLAAILVAVGPPILQWHISGGGFVRSLGAVWLYTGLYTGLKLFTTRDRRWLWPSVVLFGLTILTHPVYTAFFGVSYIWLFVYFDRSLTGLLEGAAVAVGGIALASPWWLTIISYHGVGIFAGAAGTHGGIGKQLFQLIPTFVPGSASFNPPAVLFSIRPGLFNLQSSGMMITSAFFALYILSGIYLAWRREFFLPGWFAVCIVLVSKPRFVFTLGPLMAAVVIFDVLRLTYRRLSISPQRRRRAELATIFLVAILGMSVSVFYAGGHLNSHAGSTSQPAFINGSDVETMEWVDENTEPDATFVVVGDAAEWFPLYTDRTILVGPWGVEWRGQAQYEQQLGLFNRLSTCRTEACITKYLTESGTAPEYLYVPKGEYSVRGMESFQSSQMRQELVDSGRYDLVYENRGAMVFEVVD